MDISTLRQRYAGFSDDEIATALQQTRYQDFSLQEVRDALGIQPPKRNAFAVANDTVIGLANSVAGGAGAVAEFVSPGNRFSQGVREFQRMGEESQSDAVKAGRAEFAQELEAAQGAGDELAAVGRYVVRNPLQAAAQAAGAFVGPGVAIKGAQGVARVAGAGAKAIERAGLAGGAAAGAALSGGDAAGQAFELAKQAGATDEEAAAAARNASIIPAAVGGVGGLVGAERVFAGAGGFAGGAVARAAKTGLVEGAQEAFEEGVTNYEGRRAAQPFDPSIDPAKGTAAAAGMGFALGGITGAGVGALTNTAARDAVAMEALATTNDVGTMIAAADQIAGTPLEFPVGDAAKALVPAEEPTTAPGARPDLPANAIEFEPPINAPDLQLAPASEPLAPAAAVAPEVPAPAAAAMQAADALSLEGDRAPRRRSDAVELQPVAPTPAADPVVSFVDRMRQVNTPQARAFVQDFNAGRITRRDVIRVMQSQGQDPMTADERLAEAAAQAPVQEAGGLQVPKVYRSRTAATVQARRTGGEVVPVEGGFTVQEVTGARPDAAGTGGRGAADTGAGDGGVVLAERAGRPGTAGSAVPGADAGVAVGNDGRGIDQALNQPEAAPAVQAAITAPEAGVLPATTPASEALNAASQAAPEARVIARVGRTPNAAVPVELRPNADGTVTPVMEGEPMLDFDSGAPITLPADVSPEAAKQAIRAAGALSSKQNFFAPAQQAVKASRKADPERAALTWRRTERNTEGPEFYGRDVDLIALRQMDTESEFSENSLPLGHAVHVRQGNTAHKFLVADRDGSVLGEAYLEVTPDGKIDAVHDIEMTDKRAGAGRKVMEAILANADGPVRIVDILDQSEAFWQRMGTGYKDTYGNATTDWQSYRAAQRNDARGGQGAGPAPRQELEAGRQAAGEYEGGQGGAAGPAERADAGDVDPKARRGTRPAAGMRFERAKQLADAYEGGGLNRVNVARNINELPEQLRKKLSGFGDDVRGAYFPGEDQVWVFSDKVGDQDELHFVVMHEAFHRGLGKLIGEPAKRLLRQMYFTNAKLRKRADTVARELKVDRDTAIEEALADMAGEGKASDLRGWGKLANMIRGWLAKIGQAVGIKRDFTDKDIETFVAAISRAGVAKDPAERSRLDGVDPKVFRPADEVKASRAATALPPNAPTTEAAANTKAGWSLDKSTRLDDLVYELQDKLVDTKQAMAAIRQTLGDIKSEFDPYLQEELYHGRAAKQTTDFLNNEVRPLLSEVARSGVSMAELEKYLHARHAEERNEQIAKVNPAMPDGGSGMKTAEARKYLAGLTAAQREQLEALAKRVDAITEGTRQHLVDTGLESEEAVKAWREAYKAYVPLQRADIDAGGSTRGTGAGFSVRGSSAQRAMGSDREVENILANVVLQRERAITRAEKNRVAQAVYGLAIKAPNKGFWRAVDPDANERTPAQLKELQAELIDLGLDPEDADSVFQEPKQRYVDPKTGLVSQRINPVMRSANNVLSLRVNGKDRFVFFSDRDDRAMRMVTALKNLDAPQLGAVMNTAGKITRYFSAINTSYNPIFGIINLMRDFQSALLNQSTTEIAGREKEVARHVPAALKGIMLALRARRAGLESDSSWAKLFDEFERAGGRTGYRDLYETAQDRANQLQKEINRAGENKGILAFRAAGELLSDYNDTMENALRLSAYKVAREQGLTPEKAASLAKNLTVNFNRKGHLTTQIGALYGFFNASAQGTARLVETMRGPRGKKIVAGGLLLGALQAMLLASAGFDDGQPPEFVRERNFIIPTGEGQYIAIPLPLGLHILPNLARVPIEWALGGYKDTPKKIGSLVGQVIDAFNPIGGSTFLQTLTPTVMDPIAALAENKDFSGRAIVKEDFGNRETPGFTRAKDTATPWARGMSYVLNWLSGGTDYKPGAFSPSPDAIDYLIGQGFGGVGREVSKVFQTGTAAMTGEMAELPSYKIPLLGRLYGDTTETAAVASVYYEHLRQMRLHAQEVKGRRENGESVVEYFEDHPEARYAKVILDSEKTIAALRKVRKVMKERGIDDDKLQVFDKRINAAMKAVNERFDALKQPATS